MSLVVYMLSKFSLFIGKISLLKLMFTILFFILTWLLYIILEIYLSYNNISILELEYFCNKIHCLVFIQYLTLFKYGYFFYRISNSSQFTDYFKIMSFLCFLFLVCYTMEIHYYFITVLLLLVLLNKFIVCYTIICNLFKTHILTDFNVFLFCYKVCFSVYKLFGFLIITLLFSLLVIKSNYTEYDQYIYKYLFIIIFYILFYTVFIFINYLYNFIISTSQVSAFRLLSSIPLIGNTHFSRELDRSSRISQPALDRVIDPPRNCQIYNDPSQITIFISVPRLEGTLFNTTHQVETAMAIPNDFELVTPVFRLAPVRVNLTGKDIIYLSEKTCGLMLETNIGAIPIKLRIKDFVKGFDQNTNNFTFRTYLRIDTGENDLFMDRTPRLNNNLMWDLMSFIRTTFYKGSILDREQLRVQLNYQSNHYICNDNSLIPDLD